jgi:protein required for attachment to host cells
LIEREDLVNPEGELTLNEKFSDTRGGRRGRSSVGGGGYSLDKRVERHEDEFDRRFAREVASGAARFVRSQSAGQLVVAAAPRFLGHLRAQFQRTLPGGVAVFEIPTDLTWHTSSRIARKLIQQGLLERKELPQAAYRPRAQHPAKKKPTRSRQARS